MKNSTLKQVIAITVLLCTAVSGRAQEEEKKKEPKWDIHPSIETYYQLGGMLSSEDFVFRNGLGVQVIANTRFGKRVYYGIGTGYEQMEHEQLIPVFFDVKGFVRKDKGSAYFSGQLGYSFMWNDDFAQYNSYTFRGGIMFSPGVGYKLPTGKGGHLLFNASYKQQYGTIEYESAGEEYTDRLSFNLLVFKIGYLF